MLNESPNIRMLKKLHSFCPSYFPLLITKTFFGRISPYFNLYLSAEIVNEIVGKRDRNTLIALVLITVFGNFVIAVLGGFLNRVFGHSETVLNQNEASYCNQKTLSLDYVDLENPAIRQLRRKIAESAQIDWHGKQLLLISFGRLVNITVSAFFSVALSIEMFVILFAEGFNWSVVLFAALLVSIVLFNVWYSFRVKEKLGVLSNQISQTMIDENRIDEAVECYNMGKDVRLYRQDKLIMKIKEYAFNLHKKAFRTRAIKSYALNIPLSVTNILLQAILYLFICGYASAGVFGVGSIVKYVGIVATIIACITGFFSVSADIKYNTPFVEDCLAYYDLPQKKAQGTEPVKGVRAFESGSGYKIEFRDVSFKYPGSDRFALRKINITIESGERLAVVGENGSGKTTFIKLMCRLYDPTEGVILLNGTDIREYDYAEYLSIFSIVFQDYKLFSFSLGQNVATSSKYEAERVIDCLEQSGFRSLEDFPNGLNTPLYRDFDENGIELSGGEAQKIAIARTLYKNAPFLILDEPTASLDPVAEHVIYSGFNEIVRGRTAIYISHRLSSCRFCDRIAVFHEGSIVQTGTHIELLSSESGKYHELWNAQAQYYTESTI